jgi:hypothetical protein
VATLGGHVLPKLLIADETWMTDVILPPTTFLYVSVIVEILLYTLLTLPTPGMMPSMSPTPGTLMPPSVVLVDNKEPTELITELALLSLPVTLSAACGFNALDSLLWCRVYRLH